VISFAIAFLNFLVQAFEKLYSELPTALKELLGSAKVGHIFYLIKFFSGFLLKMASGVEK
jgi:hypothetical protein